MNRNLNRRKFSIFYRKRLFFILLTFIFLFSIFTFYFQKNLIIKSFTEYVRIFSNNFDYELKNFIVNELVNVENIFIEKKVNKYFKSSIFLLPLDKIRNEIKENNWIKNVKLSTNYKDTLFIDIQEYSPFGIYNFNNNNFFFDIQGKIIEKVNADFKNNEALIIFSGKTSNLEASSFIDMIYTVDFQNMYKINNVEYINKRRWNIYLKNKVKLMLSENDPKRSLYNFINIEKNLSEIEMNNIKHFDLRDINKTLITYKE